MFQIECKKKKISLTTSFLIWWELSGLWCGPLSTTATWSVPACSRV